MLVQTRYSWDKRSDLGKISQGIKRLNAGGPEQSSPQHVQHGAKTSNDERSLTDSQAPHRPPISWVLVQQVSAVHGNENTF